MFKVLIVGCGDLGGAVASQLVQAGIEVIGVRRSAQVIDGIHIIAADVTQPASLGTLKQIQPDVLVYCVAANGQTDEQYKAHYVDGLRNVLATQSENPKLKHVFFVSSTRVYGQITDELLDESIAAIPADFGGKRLLEAENLLSALQCNSTVLRLSGIYGPGRLRMINLAKTPENWPVQNSWTNRIHRDDAAAFMVFLIQQVLAGEAVMACYIVTDSRPATQYEVLNWIAVKLHINTDTSTQVPIEGGKRLSNHAMQSTGFKLQYLDYQAGYGALLEDVAPSISSSAISSPEQRG
jgi:nucleoside-diphosphate-sugar epimerase